MQKFLKTKCQRVSISTKYFVFTQRHQPKQPQEQDQDVSCQPTWIPLQQQVEWENTMEDIVRMTLIALALRHARSTRVCESEMENILLTPFSCQTNADQQYGLCSWSLEESASWSSSALFASYADSAPASENASPSEFQLSNLEQQKYD